MAVLARNKEALHDYHILEEYEGGLALTGAEVKAARAGHLQLKGSFLSIERGELFIKNMFIGPYAPAGPLNELHEPSRNRKVLVRAKELKTLIGKKQAQGLTIVPISVYTKGNYVKLGFAVARGKKLFEKRDMLKKADDQRRMRTALRDL
jgi:SsrA-binding protein